MRRIIPVLILLLMALPARAQTTVELVLDVSGSMQGSKLVEAKKAVVELFRSLTDSSMSSASGVQVGLRVLGSAGCNRTEMLVPFTASLGAGVEGRIQGLSAAGATPLARALQDSAGDLKRRKGERHVIAVTDGYESCGGDPCRAAARLRKQGIVKTTYVIGVIESQQDLQQFQACPEWTFQRTGEADLGGMVLRRVAEALGEPGAEIAVRWGAEYTSFKLTLSRWEDGGWKVIKGKVAGGVPWSARPYASFLKPGTYQVVASSVTGAQVPQKFGGPSVRCERQFNVREHGVTKVHWDLAQGTASGCKKEDPFGDMGRSLEDAFPAPAYP